MFRLKTTPFLFLAFLLASCRPVPLETTERLVEVNGTNLYVKTIGEGEPVIFLHGGGGSHRYFLPFLEQLADSFQLVFYDQRGTGLSDGNLDLSALTISQFAEDLEALRVALGYERFSLVGHSWGAVIALSYANQFEPRLDRLVLVDPIPLDNNFLFDFSETFQQRMQSLSPEDQQMAASLCSGSLEKLSEEQLAACSAINAQIRFFDPEKALALDPTVDENTARNAALVQSRLRTDFNLARLDIAANLPNLGVPALIMHGVYDPIPAESSEYIQEKIPSAELALFSESGHFPWVEEAEIFLEIVRDFLDK